jgi:hypothetical protein
MVYAGSSNITSPPLLTPIKCQEFVCWIGEGYREERERTVSLIGKAYSTTRESFTGSSTLAYHGAKAFCKSGFSPFGDHWKLLEKELEEFQKVVQELEDLRNRTYLGK